MCGESKPIPNAMVAITTLHEPICSGEVCQLCFFDGACRTGCVHVYAHKAMLSVRLGRFSIRECAKRTELQSLLCAENMGSDFGLLLCDSFFHEITPVCKG